MADWLFTPSGCWPITEPVRGRVTVIRQLTGDEADDEVGPMFLVRNLETGFECDAFEDELEEIG
jgi:hypothetical protein